MEWTNVKDKLPEEPKAHEQVFVDVWEKGERITDANYQDGKFFELVTDNDGDYSHKEDIKNVTHWLVVTSP